MGHINVDVPKVRFPVLIRVNVVNAHGCRFLKKRSLRTCNLNGWNRPSTTANGHLSLASVMSPLGHFQTWTREVARSALPSRTDVASRACQVRNVPKPDSRSPFEFRCKASGTKLQLRLSRAVTDTKRPPRGWPFFLIFEGPRQRTCPPRPSRPDPPWHRI